MSYQTVPDHMPIYDPIYVPISYPIHSDIVPDVTNPPPLAIARAGDDWTFAQALFGATYLISRARGYYIERATTPPHAPRCHYKYKS